jgi:tRNA threonylcarbamoyladenosine biosynthesis protein TsaE
MECILHSLRDLRQAARLVLSAAADETIFLFYGPMGAGKTTLIKAICGELGIQEQVSSPTFSLVNEYVSDGVPVYHFDLYRLKNETEALDFGIEDYFDSGNRCLVEWPEKLGALLPERFLRISLNLREDHSRILTAAVVHS